MPKGRLLLEVPKKMAWKWLWQVRQHRVHV